ARLPFPALVVGTNVDVVKVESEGDERRGLSAICRRNGATYIVSLGDLTPGAVPMETPLLLSAYRRWLGLPPFVQSDESPTTQPWTYRPVASRTGDLAVPLALRPMGALNPEEQYWGDGDERDPMTEAVIARSHRAEFEMEQVIPGLDEHDWDCDPIVEAADMHGAGYNKE